MNEELEIGCGCGKEPAGRVPTARVIGRLDALLSRGDAVGAESVLRYWEREARTMGDRRGLLELFSEEVGFFRRNGKPEEALRTADEAAALVRELELADSVSGATVLLNCATNYGAFGRRPEAWPLYEEARAVYERELPPEDFRLAGLYNNMGTACGDDEDPARALAYYEQALAHLGERAVFAGEVAVTLLNMASLADRADPLDARIEGFLDRAEAELDRPDAPRDGNHAFVCEKCAPIFSYFGRFAEAEKLTARKEAIYARDPAE